jgi:thiol-disulfide isomerase/thioredoxin
MNRILISIIMLLSFACKTKQEKATGEATTIIGPTNKIGQLQIAGGAPDLSKYKGKYVFINYWATWCKPCVSEMPSLQRLTEKLRDKNIVFLFASDETTDEIAAFKRSNNYSMEFVKIDDLASLGISAIPATFIYNENGEIVYTETGSREWDTDESISMITKTIKQ